MPTHPGKCIGETVQWEWIDYTINDGLRDENEGEECVA